MFSKQITNGRLNPAKIWHLPSLADELYNGGSIEKRKLTLELSKFTETPKANEISRIPCSIFDKNNCEDVADGFQITNLNNKKHIEITNWYISTNAEYVQSQVKTIYEIDPDKAKNEYSSLAQKWNIPNANFEKDIISDLNKEKAMFVSILSDLETHIIPLFSKTNEFDDETKFESLILDKLDKLGYQYHQLDGFENPVFRQVWMDYGLNGLRTKEWSKTFAGIFLNLKQEIHHKRIAERPAGGVSELHMTKWGAMSEAENDWED
jgi:hypothetical protein